MGKLYNAQPQHVWHDETSLLECSSLPCSAGSKVEQRQLVLDLSHLLHQLFDDKPATLCIVCPCSWHQQPACQCAIQLVLVVSL